MKKIYYALCFAAVSALSVSCDVQEKFGTDDLPETVIAFSTGNTVTKSGDAVDQGEISTDVISLFEKDGESIVLEETVTSLDNFCGEPMTKGTPAYTQNISKLYGSFKAVAFDASTTGNLYHNSPVLAEASFPYDAKEGLWIHNYTGAGEPWKAASMRFFMHMPETLTGVSNLVYTKETISFDYNATSLTTAESQKDILFSTRVIDRDTYKVNDVNVLFYHALTGVKFAVGNPTEVVIKSVKFSGLYAKGQCTITPVKDGIWTGSASNAGGEESTKSSSKAVWTLTNSDYVSGYEPQQVFSSTLADYSKSNYTLPDSFHGNSSTNTDGNNLNDNNASQTFWLIPQTLDANVKLTISYTYKGSDYTQVIDFGELVKKDGKFPVWKAGELRTYTIKATSVGVSISDTVEGLVKKDVVITNTGTANQFIRVKIVGNWLNEDGVVLLPWSETSSNYYGAFTSSNGFPNLSSSSNWKLGSDGYYYYKKYIEGGKSVKEKLFNTYTVTGKPADPGVSTDDGTKLQVAKFEMVLMVQAVRAESNLKSFKEAWGDGMASWIGTPAKDE